MDCYTAALTLLSRRELSARQLRDRLARRKYAADEIDTVITRLTQDGTLDDRRVALASAHMAAIVKRRGRRRILHGPARGDTVGDSRQRGAMSAGLRMVGALWRVASRRDPLDDSL